MIILWILLGMLIVIGLIGWYLWSLWQGMKDPYKVEK
jgi:hypothetical protein